MNWELAGFLGTLAVQLVIAGAAWGKFGQKISDHGSRLEAHDGLLERHSTMLNEQDRRISVAEAYQQGLKDGTSHMRNKA